MVTSILIIEGKYSEYPNFAAALQKKGFEVMITSTGTEAVSRLDDQDLEFLLVVVNAASMRTSGVRICQSLKQIRTNLPVILIVAPDKKVPKGTADVILTLPFTVQKLANRIRPLLPGDGKNVVSAGPIRLDLEHRRVHSLGKNARLTPRLVKLLHLLMQHRGEVIDREELFKQVWDTSYTGDTRTLDVHISWLRKAIELDPNVPRFLKTIRGVGYRLDV